MLVNCADTAFYSAGDIDLALELLATRSTAIPTILSWFCSPMPIA